MFSLCLRRDLQRSVISPQPPPPCVCVCVCVCVWCVCMCGVCVCVVGVGRVASHGGDSVAVGSRLLAKIHSSLLASCFPGFIWAGEDSEFLLGTNPAGRAGC